MRVDIPREGELLGGGFRARVPSNDSDWRAPVHGHGHLSRQNISKSF